MRRWPRLDAPSSFSVVASGKRVASRSSAITSASRVPAADDGAPGDVAGEAGVGATAGALDCAQPAALGPAIAPKSTSSISAQPMFPSRSMTP
jgi:hypothetical protein